MKLVNMFVFVLLLFFVANGSLVAGQYHSWHGIRTPVPLTTAGDGFTNWQWLHPLPQGNQNKTVWLFDQQTWIVAGDVGGVMKTTNAGNTWALQFHVAGQRVMKSMSFVDRTTGFMVGDDILKSTDGGGSWFVEDDSHHGTMNAISFTSRDTGWAVGDNGVILRTWNSGESWDATVVDPGCKFTAISSIDGFHAFAVAYNPNTMQNYLVKTTNTGSDWTSAAISEDINFSPEGVCFTDQLNGWVVGWAPEVENPNWWIGYIFHTTDGGASWTHQDYATGKDGGGAYDFCAVDFADANHGVVISDGYIMSTTNGGGKWTARSSSNLVGVKMLDNQTGIVVGTSGRVLLTTDCGQTWTDIVTNVDVEYGLAFPDSAHGYTLGSNGMLRTTDGGNSWSNAPLDLAGYPEGMAFTDASHGMVISVPDNAQITMDGGNSWQTVSHINEGHRLFSVDLHQDTGWAAGQSGTIVYTSNGGQTWSPQASGTSYDLYKIHFVDAMIGTAVGQNGVIVHTTDGGQHWDLQNSGTTLDLNEIFVVDADHAFATGYAGILRTLDGGQHWAKISDMTLNGVWFSDPENGIGVSLAANMGSYMFSQIYRTTNAGETWTFWDNSGAVGLYNIVGVHSGPGYVVYTSGNSGAILVAAISPENQRTWTWTGMVNNSWNNPDNWSPPAVPQPGDSVLILPAGNNPIMDSVRTQIAIGALHILPDARLTITDSVSRLIVLGDIIIDGTLEILPTANPNIILGGTWTGGSGIVMQAGSRVPIIRNVASSGNRGFVQTRSKVEFTGEGDVSGTFYDLGIDTLSHIQSNGRLLLLNQCTLLSDLTLEPNDTLYVRNGLDHPFAGPGRVVGGTVSHFTAYSITASAGENGRILPNGTITVAPGSDLRFIFPGNAGFHADSVFIDGFKVDSLNGYTFAGVTNDHTIRVVFAHNPVVITATAGSGGGISPSGTVSVAYGGGARFTFTVNTGYHVDSVFVDGFKVDSVYGYTFANVTGNHAIRVVFLHNPVTIIATAGSGGGISPSGTVSVAYGGGRRFTFTANTGYHVDTVYVDGFRVDSVTGYTFAGVTNDHTVRVVFAHNPVVITATAGSGGGISPSGTVSVAYGGGARFTFTVNTGYHVDSVFVDGFRVDSVNGYTFEGITDNHTIRVVFAQYRYTINATAGSGGGISPSGTVSVAYGGGRRFTFTANTGYHVDTVYVDGFRVDSVNGYTFGSVTSDHTIHIVFALNRYTIEATAGYGGNIIPSGVIQVMYGEQERFVIQAGDGFNVDSVIVDGFRVDSVNGYTFSALDGSHTVRVTFMLIMNVAQGWNMVSIPVQRPDMDKTTVFPTAVGTMYDYENGYVGQSILENGVGYWAKFPTAQLIGKGGDLLQSLSIAVVQGWNMIGTVGAPFLVRNVTSDPPGMVTSRFYGYDRRYVPVETLLPWRGYWVKVNRAGTLILSSVASSTRTGLVQIVDTGEQPPLPPDENNMMSSTLPAEYRLEQNYPNPFNPATALKYALPSDSYVRLTIFNIIGQQVAILVDGIQTAGYKEVRWEAGTKASGLYLYRLDATSVSEQMKHFSQTRKMLLAR